MMSNYIDILPRDITNYIWTLSRYWKDCYDSCVVQIRERKMRQCVERLNEYGQVDLKYNNRKIGIIVIPDQDDYYGIHDDWMVDNSDEIILTLISDLHTIWQHTQEPLVQGYCTYGIIEYRSGNTSTFRLG